MLLPHEVKMRLHMFNDDVVMRVPEAVDPADVLGEVDFGNYH